MCTSTSSRACGPASDTSTESSASGTATGTDGRPGRDAYTVTGMTCSHCIMSVTEEVSGIEGVTAVDVNLATGRVDVGTDRLVTRDQVREAVEEAGYTLA